MGDFVRQHLIDPEICIRCHTCEEACPIGAITHDDLNVVVDAAKCNHCMTCIAPCPTGSIDNWRVVAAPYSVAEQLTWCELPAQQDTEGGAAVAEGDATVAALIAEAHRGAGGRTRAPASASRPVVNLHGPGNPLEAIVQGNYRLTAGDEAPDVRHIVLDFGRAPFPALEGQSIGIIPPGTAPSGRPHLPRLYSVSSPRDGERPARNDLSLTVRRVPGGVCSNYVCNLAKGDTVRVAGPFGSTFLLPGDPAARLVMICTGTGAAPFRGFTMRRQRVMPEVNGSMLLFFGARTPSSLPYFGGLNEVPEAFLARHFAFSRIPGEARVYVQDKLRAAADVLAPLLLDPDTHIYVCGLRQMEAGVEAAFRDIAAGAGLDWAATRDALREAGRYHVETY